MMEERCDCGWELPLSVMPVTLESMRREEPNVEVIADACVTLVCPRCHHGHSFFHPDAAQRSGMLQSGGEG